MPLNLSSASRWGLNALFLLSLSVGLYLGRAIFIPTVIALLLTSMLWPAVRWLNRQGVLLVGLEWRRGFPWLGVCTWRLRFPWAIACGMAVGVLVIIVLATTFAFSVAIPRFLQSLPNDPERVEQYYSKFRDRINRISPWPLDEHYFPEEAEKSALMSYLRNALDPRNPQFVLDTLEKVVSLGGYWLWQSILIMFILFFLLLEGRTLSRRIMEIFGPSPEHQERVSVALADMGMQVRTFLVWRTIINFAMAIIFGVVYQLLGLNQAWLWALLTSILLYVPYLGPILAGAPPILDAFLTCESPWVALWLFVFYVTFVTIEGYFIVPLVMGRSMDLNATTVMLSCLYWELVWGPAGLLLAMPVMAAAKTICAYVPEWRGLANLMDTREGPSEESTGTEVGRASAPVGSAGTAEPVFGPRHAAVGSEREPPVSA